MSPAEHSTPLHAQGEVAEFQGLYGTFHVHEILLQKIWLRREFLQTEARTGDGERLEILDPGRWNRLAGPDFLGARLRIAGREVRGDVEIHFRADSWIQHGHDRDPAYDNVVLHVVLFPPPAYAPPARTRSGRAIPVLALMDLLWHDLEEYATDDAIAALSRRDPWPALEQLLALPGEERRAVIEQAAQRRWEEKCHFAAMRIRRLGWAEACHQTALEVLGYRSNRVAMLHVAQLHPLGSWCERRPPVSRLYDSAQGVWSSRGTRPANHPRRRLEQYVRWMEARPDWPARLRRFALPSVDGCGLDAGVARLRRRLGMAGLRQAIAHEICADTLGGNRFDTWIANLAFPFLAAADQEEAARLLWFAWYPGDAPDSHRMAARQLTDGRRQPVSNGLLQAIIALQLDHWRADGAMPLESRDRSGGASG